MRKNNLLLIIFSAIIFLIFSLYITFPLIEHMGNWSTGTGDELVIAWIQNWVIHTFTTNPFSLFEANLYFPYHNTLAYTELFLPSSLLSIISLKVFAQPIAVVNFTLISSLFMLGFFTFLLSFYITEDFLPSLFSGMLIIFSPAVLDKKVHLQILALEWIPLSILCFLHFIKTNKTLFLILSFLFFVLQTYNSFLPGYFLVFFFLIYLIYIFFYDKRKLKQIIKKILLAFLISIALLLPIVIPYYKVSYEFHAVRDVRDAIHFALQPEDFIYPNEHTKLAPTLLKIESLEKLPAKAEVKPGYLGLLFTLLSILLIFNFFRNFKKKEIVFNVFTITSILGLLLSLGPFLHIGRLTIHKPFPIPLPYLLFYYILPGFNGFRNSARWEMLFIVCMSTSIAIFLPKLLKNYKKSVKIAIYIFLFFGVVLEYNFPMHFVQVATFKQFPKVYSYLAKIPNHPIILFMPVYNWSTPNSGEEILRDYYSIEGFPKTINGYSSFSPPPWQKLVEFLLLYFPDTKTINEIKKLKVNYIVLERDKYQELISSQFQFVNFKSFDQTIESLKTNSSLSFMGVFGDAYVFKINY